MRWAHLFVVVGAAGIAALVSLSGQATSTTPATSSPLHLAKGTTVMRADGIVVERRRWTRGPDGGVVWVATVAAGGPAQLQVVPSSTPLPLTHLRLPEIGVAINGGFYDRDGLAMGLVHVEGQTLSALQRRGGSGVFVIDHRASTWRARVVHRDDTDGLSKATYAVQSVDRVVDQGASLVGDKANPAVDARSGVCVTNTGDVVFAVLYDDDAVASSTNGRIQLNEKSTTTGVSLKAWSTLLADDLGCATALNLDGGFSTSFSARLPDGKDGVHVVDVVAHRKTINAIVAVPPSSSPTKKPRR